MRKSVVVVSVLGFIICSAVLYSAKQLALSTAYGDFGTRAKIHVAIFLNFMAACIFLNGATVKKAIRGRAKIPPFLKQYAPVLIWVAILGLVVLSTLINGTKVRDLRTVMTLATFPCYLGSFGCVYAIVVESRNSRR